MGKIEQILEISCQQAVLEPALQAQADSRIKLSNDRLKGREELITINNILPLVN